MIITKLVGGLGNQMFQYSAGRRLAITNSTELMLDISGYDDQSKITTYRNYELNIFKINADIATKKDINRIIKSPLRLIKNNYFRENSSFSYQPNILKLNGNAYLDGYWQSEKYFSDIADVIKEDFKFKKTPDKNNSNFLKRIKNSNSVSIHVRRGDYVADKTTYNYHGLCSLDYYHNAISILNKKESNLIFFVFSDDLIWAKDNIKIANTTFFVDINNGRNDHEDLRLMSRCKHNIIANSSFSWWGAWLNNNPNKTVIAPRKWFKNLRIDLSDRLPANWIKV